MFLEARTLAGKKYNLLTFFMFLKYLEMRLLSEQVMQLWHPCTDRPHGRSHSLVRKLGNLREGSRNMQHEALVGGRIRKVRSRLKPGQVEFLDLKMQSDF